MISISDKNIRVSADMSEFIKNGEDRARRLYLYGSIDGISDYVDGGMPLVTDAVEQILRCNRDDRGIPVNDRMPIKIYINSPGGDVTNGYALISAIEISKTPVYTINIGQWCSMAFLIGITGHRRFSLPNMTFLMHDGNTGFYGSAKKAQDLMKFEERFESEVIKKLIIKHSKMTEEEYEALERKEYYMLAEDALKHGFIDEIVTDIDTIL